MKIKTKEDTISITFNAAGWDPVYEKLLRICNSDEPLDPTFMGKFLGAAIEAQARKDAKECGWSDFEEWLDALKDRAKREQEEMTCNTRAPEI